MTELTTAYEMTAARLEAQGIEDKVERNLAQQHENPVKLITSGPERRAAAPFKANGKIRMEARHPWWEDYEDEALCVCGHYWRIPLPGKLAGDSLFRGYGPHDLLGRNRRDVHRLLRRRALHRSDERSRAAYRPAGGAALAGG